MTNENIVIPKEAWIELVSCLADFGYTAAASGEYRRHLGNCCKIVADANPCLTEQSEPTEEG